MAGLLTLAVLGASLSVDAFAAAVGGHMLWQAFKPPAALPDETEASRHSFARLTVTALATSIDAMAVGVSLAVLDVHIVTACRVIGAVTTGGILLGKHAGPYLGRYAEVLGGVALIAIGGFILFEHLGGRA